MKREWTGKGISKGGKQVGEGGKRKKENIHFSFVLMQGKKCVFFCLQNGKGEDVAHSNGTPTGFHRVSLPS